MSSLTPEEGKALIEKLRALRAEQRARGEIVSPPSPEETLEELERDQHAGRVVKWDCRCSPEEKVAWGEAARAVGLTQSEWARDVMNAAASEALAPEQADEPRPSRRRLRIRTGG